MVIAPRTPTLLRDLGWYGLVGGVQLVIDWAVFVGLTLAGGGVIASNVAGRLTGAALGFVANGRLTFAAADTPALSGRPLRRFLLVWLALTLLGTALVWVTAHAVGLGAAWWIKPVIDLGAAVMQFGLCRHWVYR